MAITTYVDFVNNYLIKNGMIGNATNINKAPDQLKVEIDEINTANSAANILIKLKTVDGSGSGLDADLLDGKESTNTNTNNTIVARDASGNFSAGTISAALTGNATTATKLQTARTINGVSFDGSTNITVGVSDATAVKLTGDQTIAGVKTFSSNIVGNITGNAGTATNASNLGGKAPEYYQQALGFTPIQQGGGAGQNANKIFIGWASPYLRCQVDRNDFGTTFPMNITGNAGTATVAEVANNAIGYGQTWQDVTASRALGTTYTNTTGKPIMVFVTKNNSTNNTWEFYINGVSIGYINGYGTHNSTSPIIPNGSTYMADTRAGYLVKWVELR